MRAEWVSVLDAAAGQFEFLGDSRLRRGGLRDEQRDGHCALRRNVVSDTLDRRILQEIAGEDVRVVGMFLQAGRVVLGHLAMVRLRTAAEPNENERDIG